MKRQLLALFVVFLAFAMPASAQTPPQQIPQIDLTPNMVRAFLTSLPDLQALADRYDAMAPKGDTDNPINAFQGLAMTAAAKADLNATVGAHGFGDYTTWIIVAQNIFTTFTHVKMGDVKQQMSGALAAIENNPQLTRQQKDMMLAQLGAAQTQVAAVKPSDNNIRVVTEMESEIERSLKSMN